MKPAGVTNIQIFYILGLGFFTNYDLTKVMVQTGGRSSWVSIFAASIIFALAAVIIAKLNLMHQNKVFFDYNKDITGQFFSYVFAVYYIVYFLIVGNYLNLNLAIFTTSNFLPSTPHYIVIFFAILLFSFVSYKDITNVARLSEVTGGLFLIVLAAILIAMLVTGSKENILPLLNKNDLNLETFKNLIIPFGGIEILLVIPFTVLNKKAVKTIFGTLIFLGILYVLIVESVIITLGINNAMVIDDGFVEALRVVEIPLIERMDIYYLTFNLASLFAGSLLIFTVIIEFACKIFVKVKRSVLVICFGLISYGLSMITSNMKNLDKLFESYGPVLVIISSMVIPITVFIIAKIKRKRIRISKEDCNE